LGEQEVYHLRHERKLVHSTKPTGENGYAVVPVTVCVRSLTIEA
jgi:hypothetical protein